MERHVTRRIVGCLAAFVLTVLLSACTADYGPSRVGQAIDAVSFAVPPQAGAGVAASPTSTSTATRPRAPEIFPGQPRVTGTVRPRGAQRGADGVDINFENADVREVVREIVGNILGRTYTIDPQVNGQVTLSTGGPVAERDLLLVLETVLRSIGAAIADTGNGYAVLPVQDAVGRTDIQPLGGAPLAVQPGTGITIVPLRYISATAAAQFIQPLLHNPEDIRLDQTRNLLLFAGSGAERQNVVDTLAAIDVNWLAGKSVGIFPLSLANPEALIPELEALFANPVNAPGELPTVQFVPVARLNAVLAIATTREQLAQVEQWVGRLDRGRAFSSQFYVYELRHAPAEEVAKVLNETFGEGSTAAEPTDATRTGAPSLFSRLGGGAGTGIGAAGGREPPLAAGGETGGTEARLSVSTPSSTGSGIPGGPKIVANRRNNTLLVRATPHAYELIEPAIRRLDTAPAQVLIEATIAEVTLNDSLRYGVQYFIRSGPFAVGFNNSATSGFRTPTNLEPLASVPGFNFVFTPGSSNITIDALAQITDVKVLSSPSVVVQDNSEAVLTVGDQVPIETRRAQSVDNPDAPLISNVEYRDTGVILQVRPRINANQVVALEIGQEVSRVADAGTDVNLTPTIQQRKITSRVSVLTGQTVVLGGLIQDSEQRGRSRVPGLGEVPVLGHLFGSTRNANVRTELIVFITPRIIRNADDARDISEELRARMKALRGRQGTAEGAPAPGPLPGAATPPAPVPAAPEPGLPVPLTPRPRTGQAPAGPGTVTGVLEPAAPAKGPAAPALPAGPAGSDDAAGPPAEAPRPPRLARSDGQGVPRPLPRPAVMAGLEIAPPKPRPFPGTAPVFVPRPIVQAALEP